MANSLKFDKRSHPTPSATLTPFLCDLCGKSFKQPGTLAAHTRRQHTRKKLAFCDICKKGYSTAQALVVHNRIHTGEKPYKCEHCGSTFRQQGHLKQHKDKFHLKETKYTPRPTRKISGKTDVAFAGQKHQVSTNLDENENQFSSRKEDHIPEGEVIVPPKMDQISKKCKQSNKNQSQLFHAQVNLQHTTYQISMKKGTTGTAISNRPQLKINPVSKELNKQMVQDEIKPKTAVPQVYYKSDNLGHQCLLSYGVDSQNQISMKSEKVAHDNENNQVYCAEANCAEANSLNSLKSSKKSQSLDLDANQQFQGKSAVAPNQCDVCGKIFNQRSYIKIHKRIHSGEKPYCCNICGRRYRFIHHLKFHSKYANCGKPTSQMETSGREEPMCNFCSNCHGNNENCGKPTSQLETLDREEPISDRCNNFGNVNNANCDKPTGQPETSNREEPSHTSNYCGKVYDNDPLLEMHQRCQEGKTTKKAKSKPGDEKLYKCQFCPKAFKHRAHINMHERVHTGCRPYQCDLCSMAFKQVTHLSNHKKRIHHNKGKKPCSKTNRKPKNWDKKNPYKCKLCAKTFKQEKQLKLHEKTHKLGTGPFECEVCGKAFKMWNNLRRHGLIHTGEKPFVCEICGKGCTQKSNLNSHYEKIHIKNTYLARKSGKSQAEVKKAKSLTEDAKHGSKRSEVVTSQLQSVQIDSSSDKRSIEASYVNLSSANVSKESGVLAHPAGMLHVQSEADGVNKDSNVSQLHEDSSEKPSINKKRNLLTELSKLRYKNSNSKVENSFNFNRKSSERSENTSKTSHSKESNPSIQSGVQMSNKEYVIKEHYSKSNSEYPFTRITNINSSSGESSKNFEAGDTKYDGTSKFDKTFENISKEIEENMFVCCECGENFEQESYMMKHCVDVH